MTPLRDLSANDVRALVGLVFDVDDTVLTHGKLTTPALDALWKLHRSGLRLIAATGRTAVKAEHLLGEWPIDAAIAENGALRLVMQDGAPRLVDSVPAEERRARIERLASLVAKTRTRFPTLLPTRDAKDRVADATWDIGEYQTVERARVEEIAAFLREEGASVVRSSVHLHATFDATDKAVGVLRFVHDQFGEDARTARLRYAFVGDSGNDRTCFAAFEATFGVANVAANLPDLIVPPRFVSPSAMGTGFAEIVDRILELTSAT